MSFEDIITNEQGQALKPPLFSHLKTQSWVSLEYSNSDMRKPIIDQEDVFLNKEVYME